MFRCVQGMCIWSPRIDDQGNSVRAVEFCKQLTSRYAFHVFDDVISCSEVRLLLLLHECNIFYFFCFLFFVSVLDSFLLVLFLFCFVLFF